MDSILVPSMLGFVIDPTSPQMLWADAYSCFDWQNNYAILCSETALKIEGQIQGNRHTEINGEAQRYKIPFLSAQLLWIFALLLVRFSPTGFGRSREHVVATSTPACIFPSLHRIIILTSRPVGSGSQPTFS